MTVPLHKRVKRSVRSAVIAAALRLVQRIPRGPGLRIADACWALAYHLLRKTRALALTHLGNGAGHRCTKGGASAIWDKKGLNGGSISIGPGLGVSISAGSTKTYTLREAISAAKRVWSSIGGPSQ